MYLERSFGIWPVHYWCSCLLRQFYMAAHKVGVKVRLKNVLDLHTLVLCHLQVGIYVSQGVYHSCLALTGYKISRLTQAVGI